MIGIVSFESDFEATMIVFVVFAIIGNLELFVTAAEAFMGVTADELYVV